MVSVTVSFVPFKLAVMTAVAFELCGKVVTVKAAEVSPEATVTLPGTVAAAVFELLNVTAVPSGGAAPDRVTVPLSICPPTAVSGETIKLLRVTEVLLVTEIGTFRTSPFKVALMVAAALTG
jgi:hypothetical protein